MYEGWILDVYPNYEFDTMNVWLWTEHGPRQITDRFRPCFYVHGPEAQLRECARELAALDSVDSLEFVQRRLNLESDRLYRVLEVGLSRFSGLRKIPELVNGWGNYKTFQLYDVDLRLAQKYMFEKCIFPMASVRVGRSYRLLDEVFSMNYTVPPLLCAELAITVDPGRPRGSSAGGLRYASYDEPVSAVHLSIAAGCGDGDGEGYEITLEPAGGDEAGLLLELASEIARLDPDVIYTENGDEVIFPYLYHRAELNALGSTFVLDRDRPAARSGAAPPSPGTEGRGRRMPEHAGKSYFTYGRIAYKPPFYSLKGRLHIDRRSSFIHRESGLDGLVELSRLACIPLQTMSRLSPGTAISAMQVGQAMREGVLVRWKKNQPELFKSATELLAADRGGHIFDPYAGVHDNVFELDFVSLYPSIIARKNISPETVLCGCCADRDGQVRVPGIGYHICTARRGLIAKVVAPLIARRIAYKRRGGAVCDARQKILKWVLVTCFGYTGYRNARFGRIECHESITAYARDMMLDAMMVAEELGYDILHGYVDSLWLRPADGCRKSPRRPYEHGLPAPAEVVSREIGRRIGVPMQLEGHYKWIVFLPNKSVDVGALTRYYGLFSDGSMKVRGVELRQHSTPPLFIRYQSDVLNELSKATNAGELFGRLPAVLEITLKYADEITSGRVEARELAFRNRISRTLDEYRVLNNQSAALRQLDDAGIDVHPGECVNYVILNSHTRDPYKRVALAEHVTGNENYDRRKYLEFLCRAGDSLLRPFGCTEDALADHIADTTQIGLDKYC